MSIVPFSFSSLSLSKYMSLVSRRTNQRIFQFLRERVDRPPPFLYSQPDLNDSCLERNHMNVSSFRTHQRLRHGIIKPAVDEMQETKKIYTFIQHQNNIFPAVLYFLRDGISITLRPQITANFKWGIKMSLNGLKYDKTSFRISPKS